MGGVGFSFPFINRGVSFLWAVGNISWRGGGCGKGRRVIQYTHTLDSIPGMERREGREGGRGKGLFIHGILRGGFVCCCCCSWKPSVCLVVGRLGGIIIWVIYIYIN